MVSRTSTSFFLLALLVASISAAPVPATQNLSRRCEIIENAGIHTKRCETIINEGITTGPPSGSPPGPHRRNQIVNIADNNPKGSTEDFSNSKMQIAPNTDGSIGTNNGGTENWKGASINIPPGDDVDLGSEVTAPGEATVTHNPDSRKRDTVHIADNNPKGSSENFSDSKMSIAKNTDGSIGVNNKGKENWSNADINIPKGDDIKLGKEVTGKNGATVTHHGRREIVNMGDNNPKGSTEDFSGTTTDIKKGDDGSIGMNNAGTENWSGAKINVPQGSDITMGSEVTGPGGATITHNPSRRNVVYYYV